MEYTPKFKVGDKLLYTGSDPPMYIVITDYRSNPAISDGYYYGYMIPNPPTEIWQWLASDIDSHYTLVESTGTAGIPWKWIGIGAGILAAAIITGKLAQKRD